MITLFTGKNGSGKTANVVAELLALLNKERRPVVVRGIPELLIPHQKAPPVGEWTRRVPDPDDQTRTLVEFTFPQGAIVIIDECQEIYRRRPQNAVVPDIVAAFEKHRKLGLDFWLITQFPNQIDFHVRELVSKHVHYRDSWSGRQRIEWDEVHDGDNRYDRKLGRETSMRLPKEVFPLYLSASKHTKLPRSIPRVLWVLLVAIAGLIGGGVFFYNSVSSRMFGETNLALQPHASRAAAPASPTAPTAKESLIALPDAPTTQIEAGNSDATELMKTYEPRLRGKPETAPRYDGLRNPIYMPVVAGAVRWQGQWRCITQQGTDAGLSAAECEAWQASRPFNDYDERAMYRPSMASAMATKDVPLDVDATDVMDYASPAVKPAVQGFGGM